MAHLSRWLAREGAEALGLTPAIVTAYLAERRAAGYAGDVTGRALRPLLGYLRLWRPGGPDLWNHAVQKATAVASAQRRGANQ